MKLLQKRIPFTLLMSIGFFFIGYLTILVVFSEVPGLRVEFYTEFFRIIISR